MNNDDTVSFIFGVIIGGLLVFGVLCSYQTNKHGETGRECSGSNVPCKDSRDSCQQAHVPLRPMEQAEWLCLPTGQTNTN